MKRHLPLTGVLLISALVWLSGCAAGSSESTRSLTGTSQSTAGGNGLYDVNAQAAARRNQGRSDLNSESQAARSNYYSNMANSDPLLNTGTSNDLGQSPVATDYNGGSKSSTEQILKGAAIAGAGAAAGWVISKNVNLGDIMPGSSEEKKAEGEEVLDANAEQNAQLDTVYGPTTESATQTADKDQERRSSGKKVETREQIVTTESHEIVFGPTYEKNGVAAETQMLEPAIFECAQPGSMIGTDQQLADALRELDRVVRELQGEQQ